MMKNQIGRRPGGAVVFALMLSFAAANLCAPVRGQAPPAADPAPPATDNPEAAPAVGATFLANYDPSKSFSRLLFPNTAAIVGLTATQQTEVSRLMTERSASLAATADHNAWPAIVMKSEEDLKALLTPEQLAKFQQAISDKMVTIRFSKTKWADVLKWLSAELGLQLVMNSPPPGTFNYNDKNRYTPKEALDILNGRLQFQGYTLLRNGNILYLHNFKDGAIPLQFLQKITPAELPNQSRFDYVALTLPLGMRSLPTVLASIKPFQGPYNATQALPGNALMIIDSVNALREIVPVALAIVNPPAPPAVLPVPAWKTYTLTKASPELIKTEVAKFAPSARPLVNPSANQISFLAIPGLQAVIEGLITRLEEGADPTKDLATAVYSLNEITNMTQENLWAVARRFNVSPENLLGSQTQLALGNEILAALRLVCPNATISMNELTKQIFVVARPEDQAKIKDAVEKLKAPVAESERNVFRTYSFDDPGKTLSPSELKSIRDMIPMAQVSFDRENNTLLIVGTEREQSQIADAVNGMNAHYAQHHEDQVYAAYPMTPRQIGRFAKIFDEIKTSPEMNGVIKVQEGMANRLGFWATPRQHETLRRIVNQIMGIAPVATSPNDDTTKSSLLQSLFVNASDEKAIETNPAVDSTNPAPAENTTPAPDAAPPTVGAEPNANPAPANSESAAAPAETPPTASVSESAPALVDPTEERDNAFPLEGAEGVYLAVVRLEKSDPTTVANLLTNTIPGLEVTADPATKSLSVYGTRTTLTAVRNLVDELEKTQETILDTIPYTNSFPLATLAALQRVEPDVIVTYDTERRQIFLLGKKEDVKNVRRHIDALMAVSPQEDEAIYYLDVARDMPKEILDYLQKAVPRTEVTYDKSIRRFTIVGTPTDQLLVMKIINEAQNSLPPEVETRYYTRERRISDELVRLVQEAVPEAESIDRSQDNAKVLIARARPDVQAKIAAALERIEKDYPTIEENILVFYPLDDELRGTFDSLKTDFERENGEIKIVSHENDRLAVWALPSQQEALAGLLRQLDEQSQTSENRKTARLYEPNHVDVATLAEVMTDIRPNVEITPDKNGNRLIIKGTVGKVEEALEMIRMIDVQQTDGARRSFAAFDIKSMAAYDKNGTPYAPTNLIADLERLAPAAKISFETYNQRIIVWGTEEEQKIIREAIQNLNKETDYKDRFLRHEIRRAKPETLMTLFKATFPKAQVTLDETASALVINANKASMEEVREFLDIVDPENPSPLDPTLKIYSFEKTPTQAMADSLQKLAPGAKIVIQADARQMMVIAKPSELAILDKNVSAIEGMVSPSDPFVKFYGLDHEPTPSIVRSLIQSLKKIAPEAVIDVDRNNRQLMVIARAGDQEKIEASAKSIVETFNPIDLKLVPYSVYGIDVHVLKNSLSKIYPEMKIEVDEVGKRLLIWATLDQHVRVSAEIEAVNGSAETSETDEGPRAAVYSAKSGREARMLQRLIKAMVPTAEVYSESVGDYDDDQYSDEEIFWSDRLTGEQKLTVIAAARDQKLIAALIDQQKNPSNVSAKKMETLSLADLDLDAVETTVQNILPDALSLSPADIRKWDSGEENRPRPKDGVSFFRVDPKSRTISVYADDQDLTKVKGILDQMTAAGASASMKSQVYTLSSPIAATLIATLRDTVPSARFTPSDPYQIIAYANDADQKTIANFLNGLTDLETSATHFQMKSVFLPDGCLVPRDVVVQYLSAQFLRVQGYAYSASNANQIILWGTGRVIEEMMKFIDETCRGTQEEVYKTYTVDHLDPATAVALLQRISPNATITPDPVNRRITVFGSPFVQKQVANTLAEIDAKRTGDAALTANYYNMEGFSAPLFYPIYTALLRQFPLTTIIADPVYLQFTIVATEAEQTRIGEFFKSMKEKQLETTPEFQAYYLENANFIAVRQILAAAVSTAMIFPGKSPSEFFAFAKPESQEKIRKIISQVDSIKEDGPAGKTPKIYRVDAQKAAAAVAQLAPSLPGAQLYPIGGDGVLMWGSASDHKLAEDYFGTFAEAYPATTARRYSFQHATFADAATFLTRRFYPNALIYPTKSGDMLVEASERIQEKVAEAIQAIDVPPSENAKPRAVAYDVGDLPDASQRTAVAGVMRICPEAVFLPTATEGYFVIFAKPADQEKIGAVIEKMVAERPEFKARMEKYSLHNILYTDAAKLIAQVAPTAKVNPGRDANQIYVWAKEADHAKIDDLIQKTNEEVSDGVFTRIYHLQKADLTRTQATIAALYPGFVKSLPDPISRTLTVAASELYQKKIDQLIKELDRIDVATQPSIHVFNITGISSTAVLTHVRSLYVGDPDFKANYDVANQSLVVQGTAQQIMLVSNLIDQIRQGGLSDPTLAFKTYTIRNSWSYYTLRGVFARQGRNLDMQIDYSTGKLLVLARPEEHRAIENILSALAPEPTKLAVYELKEVEPETAATIISTMLESDGTFIDVQFDDASGKLYIRATEKKLEEIRRFLIEAGETSLLDRDPRLQDEASGFAPAGLRPEASSTASTVSPFGDKVKIQGSGPLRTIRFEGDIQDILDEVQKNWTRKNRLNVIRQGESLVQTKENPQGTASVSEEKDHEGEEPSGEKTPDSKSSAEVKVDGSPESSSGDETEKKSDPPADENATPLPDVKTTSSVEAAPLWKKITTLASVSLLTTDVPNEKNPSAVGTVPGENVSDQPIEAAPGVYVVINQDGSLTITSADTEALEAFQESLLTTMKNLAVSAGGTEHGNVAGPETATDVNLPGGHDAVSTDDEFESEAELSKNIRYLARQNREAAEKKLVMEDRNYSVYRIENVSVAQMISRLTVYMADKLNPKSAFTPSPYAVKRNTGVSMKTISSGPRLEFKPDNVLNTIMVIGNKSDRDEAGAMIAVLDKSELFPQPITKPFKIQVRNTSVTKMAQQVLNVFQLKFMSTQLPGGLSPRISPNTESNILEIYAPEGLANEIKEYVAETDKEILEDKTSQVKIVPLEEINAMVFQKYINSLKGPQNYYIPVSPYMLNPSFTRQPAARQF